MNVSVELVVCWVLVLASVAVACAPVSAPVVPAVVLAAGAAVVPKNPGFVLKEVLDAVDSPVRPVPSLNGDAVDAVAVRGEATAGVVLLFKGVVENENGLAVEVPSFQLEENNYLQKSQITSKRI